MAELAPDLLFLDVQMPKLDGFEVLELLGREVPVIFITAYDEFALRAFEVHAVDYLLKPFREERLGEALSRARGRLAGREGEAAGEAPLDVGGLLAAARPRSGPLERVVIRDGAHVHVIPADRSTTSRRRTTTWLRRRRQDVPQGADAGGLEEALDPRASCASTGRICSTSSGSRGSSSTRRTAGWRS